MSKYPETALISVTNKVGIEAFGQNLVDLGCKIISSGGTAKVLAAGGVPVTDIAEIIGGEPPLGELVKTLYPHIHGGLLAAKDMLDKLEKNGYPWIDLVCVDFYPLTKKIAEKATLEEIRLATDIGGPSMLRSGAKGRRITICDPADRQKILVWLRAGSPDNEVIRLALAGKVEKVVAAYCDASGDHLIGLAEEMPTTSEIGAALKEHLLGSLPSQLALARDASDSASD